MGWTIAVLFAVSAVLFIISMAKARNQAISEQKEIEMLHLSLMDEINRVKEDIRNVKLDLEIAEKEAGVQLSAQDKLYRREILDLYKRDYSIDSIAAKKQASVSEIQELLAPFIAAKNERSKVAHGNK
ncbi:hypothetical protein [Heyndrickxia acidiproducens]|uniref:hypothetical protein n=1 Tax=Heyndrickxia acidiproducens TaxID=1121084 RepID=UPI000370EAA5|nr:hypothetical protein [Heyndrickxia acidiproducens]